MRRSFIPIAFPNPSPLPDGLTILAADIGGTKTDLALFEVYNDEFRVIRETIYPSAEWQSFIEMVRHFGITGSRPDRLSVAIAGPVQDGRARTTNLDWEVDSQELCEKLAIDQVFLINDLKANAYGLAALESDELLTIYPGKVPASGNAAVIAPGTGLGEAGLYWDGKFFHPFANEGGHTDFGPRSELDVELWRYLHGLYGHVSWERIVSGPGIHTIYRFLRDIKKLPEPLWLKAEMKEGDPTPAISRAAVEGIAICRETMQLFTRYLASEAANLALKIKATGGLYIGGGITPRIWDDKLQEIFLKHFFDAGRLRHLLEEVPVHININPKTALLGAALYGGYGVVGKNTRVLLQN